jgi:hypothetical protein
MSTEVDSSGGHSLLYTKSPSTTCEMPVKLLVRKWKTAKTVC